jgi:hypothetical protein
MHHHDTLVIPYGTSDIAIAFATVPIAGLLGRMRRAGCGGAARQRVSRRAKRANRQLVSRTEAIGRVHSRY